jgi:cell division protein FtsI (penicillin-binding protein 3)
MIEDPEATASRLAEILDRDAGWQRICAKRLNSGKQQKRRYKIIERRLETTEAQSLERNPITGIFLEQESWRHYPGGWLGSHLLGFINRDQSVQEGLEQYYHQDMKGKEGSIEVLQDARKNGLLANVVNESVQGSDLELTIDLNIQLFVEDALRRARARTSARAITAIVIDPSDGAVLALANVPDFNPNRFSAYPSKARGNRAVMGVYEPGSAFKVVTVAAALDSGSIRTDQKFLSKPGRIQVFDKSIRNHAPYGNLTLPEVLWHSSNSGAVQIALSMTPETFDRYIRRFGFGTRTGIDLPVESPGILRPLAEWERSSRHFLAMGHEISTTPLQMVTALSAVANGGLRVHPYVVRAIHHPDGRVEDRRPTAAPVTVIKPSVATYLARSLLGVVETGTARAAAIPGVAVFGKTGTAQRIQGRTYAKDKYNSSFVGFFPAEAPRYGMIVVVHDPKGTKVHGGDVAAPIFSEIGSRIMDYERARMPRQKLVVTSPVPDWSMERPLALSRPDAVPDFRGMGLRNLLQQSRRLGLRLTIKGNGRVVDQSPPAGAEIPADRRCSILLKEG